MTEQTTTTDTTTLYCANHPQVETALRCSRCEKPICSRCAVLTPTGYRCRECVRGQQKIFDTAQWYDFPLAILVAGGLAYIGSRIVPALGFFTIFLAPVAGVIIAEAVRFVIRRRRSKLLFQLTTGAVLLACLPTLLLLGLSTLASLSQGGGFGLAWRLIWQVIYTFIVASTVYYRISGIQMRR
jgi:hypothetical protein